MVEDIKISKTIDAKGLQCPIPILKTTRAIRDVPPGEVLEVFTTDPGSKADMIAWAKRTENHLIHIDEDDDVFRFLIRRVS